jgi:hypothetical protein
VWRIRLPLGAFIAGFEQLQRAARPAACSHWPPRVSMAVKALAVSCNFVDNEQEHSAHAQHWRDVFLRATALGRYSSVHIRRGVSACNDTLPTSVQRLVDGQLPDRQLPLVLYSNSDEASYLSALARLLAPRKLVFADEVLRKLMGAASSQDNYLLFAAERAIAGRAVRPFQIGYRPCGRVTQGWAGTWRP